MNDPMPLKTKPDPDTDARIVLAACAVGGTVYTGWRHSVIMVEQLKPLGLMTQSTSGFLDQHGFFWDREMSARIASAAKQTSVFHGSLMSENLWDMDGTPRSPSGPYNPLGDVKPSPPINEPVVLHDLVLRTTKLSDEGELRRLWTEAGGSFHGPNVEHGSMPKAKLLPFLGALIRDRDIAKASAQTACEQLTQQMARSDELAAKLHARDDVIDRYAKDAAEAITRAEAAERDAAEAKGTAIGLHRIARDAESRAAALAEALRRMRQHAVTYWPAWEQSAACTEVDAVLAGNGTDDAPPVTPLHPVKDVGVRVENKKTGKLHEWDGTAWRPVPVPVASTDDRIDTLGDALPREQARVREVLGIYKSIGPAGAFGAAMIEADLQAADKAVMSGDVVAMLAAYQRLKGIKE